MGDAARDVCFDEVDRGRRVAGERCLHQTEMLLRVFSGQRGEVDVSGSVALVAGDRQTDGVFPLWSIARNITIGSLRDLLRGRLVDARAEDRMATRAN